LLLSELKNHSDLKLASIAEKSLKEVTYHLKWSSEWMIRLGDGTEESHNKIQKSVNDLVDFTDEMFIPTNWELELIEQNMIPDIRNFRTKWEAKVLEILNEATLTIEFDKSRKLIGGKDGKHTEKMGYILAEMQMMQRTYPNMEW
jgi:ring-1,2-phenylacetyl-CoA epoxidase subunit PaaC